MNENIKKCCKNCFYSQVRLISILCNRLGISTTVLPHDCCVFFRPKEDNDDPLFIPNLPTTPHILPKLAKEIILTH